MALLRSSEENKTSITETTTVYVTRTGSKYHRGSCQYLRKSKIPMSKVDAVSGGYGAGSRCKP